MARGRDRRRRRPTRRARQARRPNVGPADRRRARLQRIVIAFLVVVGLAGVLVVSAPADEPSGRPPIG